MRTLLLTSCFLALSLTSTAALAQRDSTGQGSNLPQTYGDVLSSTTWDRIQNKPTTFPPDPHHHDSRYLQLDKVAKNCPDGQFVAGIKNNGTLNCQKLPSTGSTSVARPGPYGIREGGGCSSGAQRFCDPFGNCSCRMPGP